MSTYPLTRKFPKDIYGISIGKIDFCKIRFTLVYR